MINLLTIPIIPIAANTDNAFPVCKNSSIKKLPFLLQIVPDDIYYSRPSLVWEDENCLLYTSTVPQRIVAIADIVSALTGTRSYKDSFPKEKTCSILNDMAERGLIDSVIVERIVENYDVIMGAVREKATPILEIYQEMQLSLIHI